VEYSLTLTGTLLVDLRLVESSPPWYFALLVGTRLVDVPLRDTHGRAEGLLLVLQKRNHKLLSTGISNMSPVRVTTYGESSRSDMGADALLGR
jgi:hypothetical protein